MTSPTCTKCNEPWLDENHRCQDQLVARLTDELLNIIKARRFDREYFDNDTSFADWVQSRARFALAAQEPRHD